MRKIASLVAAAVLLSIASAGLLLAQQAPRGITGYLPPCPPQNVPLLLHHYAFDMFALDTKVDLPDKGRR